MPRWLKPALRWLAAVLCAAWAALLLYRGRDDLRGVLALRPAAVGAIVALYLAYYGLFSLRLQIIIERAGNARVGAWPWFRLMILARFLNSLAPQAGNIYRGVRLKRDFGIAYTRYVAACISYAWLDSCQNLLIAGAILLAMGGAPPIAGVPLVVWLFALAALVGVAPWVARGAVTLLPPRGRLLAWLRRHAMKVAEVTLDIARDRGNLARFSVLGIATFALLGGVMYICFRALGFPVALPAVAAFLAMFKISMVVNLTPGNLGVRELACGLLAETMGIGMAQGILVSAVLRVISTTLIAALALSLGGLSQARKLRGKAGQSPDSKLPAPNG